MPPRGGLAGATAPEASKKLKLFCSVICCNDIKVKYSSGLVSISCPGPVVALGGRPQRVVWEYVLTLTDTWVNPIK